MKLTTRMWLQGTLLPIVLLSLALVATGIFFHRGLLRSLDQQLRAQAAVEAVSLFDTPTREPHLHLSTSPLEREVRGFVPRGFIYGPGGRLLQQYPQGAASSPELLTSPQADTTPSLKSHRDGQGIAWRELSVRVLSPSGTPYTLRLSASLVPIQNTLRMFATAALVFLAVSVGVLLAVQFWQARKLSGRLMRLTRHVGNAHGWLDAPPPDEGDDEIRSLRDTLAIAGERLRAARAGQEQLIANAAHELRTPLSLMRTRLDLALRRHRSPEELLESMRELRAEVDRLTGLASRLLEMASVGRGSWDRSPSNLLPLIEEAVSAARADAELKSVLIEIHAPVREQGTSEAMALVHLASVRQALDNLLSNALRHSPPGKGVTVGLERAPRAWRLWVADGGPGVPPSERSAIFEPFHRATTQGPGAGLGLAIVREIAKRNGGEVWVEESPGGGARFVLSLPEANG